MMIFYVSCRAIQMGSELILPSNQFMHEFRGIDIDAQLIASNRSVDGRLLYQVTLGLASDYSEEECDEYKAVILEGLAAWGVHLKTLESAKELAEKLTGLVYNIDGDEIVCAESIDPRA